MEQLILPVILAGGQGTRLWPMSRSARPKQFLRLTSQLSLFQETLERVANVERYAPALVITHADYRFIVAEQAAEVSAPLSGILLEPMPRGTAAAITAASLLATEIFGAGVLLHILPSDLAVTPNENYWVAIDRAAEASASGKFVIFGVTPTRPETAYSYIEPGLALIGDVATVERFVGKPDRAEAQAMIAAGCLWNSGMLMVAADALLDECRALASDTLDAACAALAGARTDTDFIRLDPITFAQAPDITIDHAVLEKTGRAAMVPASFEWSDMGSWDSVWQFSDRDVSHNATGGAVSVSDATNCLVITEGAHVVVAGLDDIVAIVCADAIYVGKLSQAQKVGPLAKMLRDSPTTRGLTESNGTVYASWGRYVPVLEGEGFTVARLFVEPGKVLVLEHSADIDRHLVIVCGTAELSVQGIRTLLPENKSIHLPPGTISRLANPGRIPVEIIEVRCGEPTINAGGQL